MSVELDIKLLVARFEDISRTDMQAHGCEKLYCTTCGGLAGKLEDKLDQKTKSQIEATLDVATRSDIYKFGFWQDFITRIYGTKCLEIVEKEQAKYREKLDMDSPRDIDFYLFDARHMFNRRDPDYCSLITRGIELAIEKEDVSLIETLILVLGEEANNYPGFVNLAINKSDANEKVKRALYNKLRHVRVDVRSFKGDGCTVHPLDT